MDRKDAVCLSVGLSVVLYYKMSSILNFVRRLFPDRCRYDPDVYSAMDVYKRELFWHLKEIRHSKKDGVSDELSILEVCYNPILTNNFKYFPPDCKNTILCEDRSLRRVSEKRSYMTVGNLEALQRFEDASFDAVVVTLMLCSSSDVERDIKEIYRLLVHGGHLYFLEHEPVPFLPGQEPESRFQYIFRNILLYIGGRNGFRLSSVLKKQRFIKGEVVQSLFFPEYYPDRQFVLGYAIK